MPFLRVIRDKRGYETTYLMHVYREGSRQQTRILYAFRTPGGVRVGREALEPDVLKQVEAQHPNIDFDWGAVFQSKQLIEPGVETRRPRQRQPADAAAEPRETRRPPSQPQQPPAPLPAVPSTIEGDTPDARVGFLTHWYAVVRERIERISDPGRRDPLLLLAERLNPAAWTDIDQITAGLNDASEALEQLSLVLARRRRRPKKRGGHGSDESAIVAPAVERDDSSPAEAVEIAPPTTIDESGDRAPDDTFGEPAAADEANDLLPDDQSGDPAPDA